jgi:CRISPR-associated protein Csx10
MSEPLRFVIDVELLSDLHVGSGLARGTLDATVARDPDGLPEVPATTLRGVLRDSAEAIAAALDTRDDGSSWRALTATLFGTQPSLEAAGSAGPTPGALTLRGARIRGELRSRLLDREIVPLLTGPRSQVRIDRGSGTASDDMLRTIEVARAGLLLAADVQIDVASLGPATDAAVTLLAAAAGITTRVGGGRRRGLGHVSMRLSGEHSDGLDDERRTAILSAPAPEAVRSMPDGAPNAPAGAVSDGSREADSAGDGDAVAVSVIITTVDPVLVPRRMAGNVTESHDHIPGRVLLPLVAQALRGLGVDPGPEIASGRVRVTDARPASSGRGSTPTPFCLAREPGATEVINRLVERQRPGMKPLRGGHLSYGGGDRISIERAGMVLRMHNAVDDETGRVGDADSGGGLFAVSAIDARSRLAGHVLLAPGSGVDPEQLARALEGDASIGTARRGSYGAVRIVASVAGREERPVEWGEVRDVAADGTFVVWLVSDCVLLDPATLAPDPTVTGLLAEVARGLGLDAGALRTDTEDDAVHTRTARHDAWHARWGTPRPTLPALCAGSVVRVRTDAPIEKAWLEALVRRGVGERRGEGFGRIAIDPAWSARTTLRLEDWVVAQSVAHDATAGPPLSEGSVSLVAALEGEALERRWASLVDAAGRRSASGKDRHPLPLGKLSRAQRGLLRSAASFAASQADLAPLETFVERQQERVQKRSEQSAQISGADGRWADHPALVEKVRGLAEGEESAVGAFVDHARSQGLMLPPVTELVSCHGDDRRRPIYVRLVAGALIASVRAAEGERP